MPDGHSIPRDDTSELIPLNLVITTILNEKRCSKHLADLLRLIGFSDCYKSS